MAKNDDDAGRREEQARREQERQARVEQERKARERAGLNQALARLQPTRVAQERALRAAEAKVAEVERRQASVQPGAMAKWHKDLLSAQNAVQVAGQALQTTTNEISRITQALINLG